MSKKLTYDQAFAELNEILVSLQSDEAGLDDLAEKLKKAAELAEFCKAKLRAIESEVEKLSGTDKTT